MKKVLIFALAITTALSTYQCGDEIEFNSPAIQALKDGQLWKAQFNAADIDFGGFLIEGGRNFETVQLVTSNDVRGTFELGGDSPNVAIFKDANGIVYSTANAPDPSVSVYPSDGQIIVDNIINSDTDVTRIVGTFWFNAYTADGLSSVNFNEGVFYRVGLFGGLEVIDNGSVCLQASQQTAIAQSAFNATDTTMPDYTDVCNAYKAALNVQITSCGDASGMLQATIESLGDCM